MSQSTAKSYVSSRLVWRADWELHQHAKRQTLRTQNAGMVPEQASQGPHQVTVVQVIILAPDHTLLHSHLT